MKTWSKPEESLSSPQATLYSATLWAPRLRWASIIKYSIRSMKRVSSCCQELEKGYDTLSQPHLNKWFMALGWKAAEAHRSTWSDAALWWTLWYLRAGENKWWVDVWLSNDRRSIRNTTIHTDEAVTPTGLVLCCYYYAALMKTGQKSFRPKWLMNSHKTYVKIHNVSNEFQV